VKKRLGCIIIALVLLALLPAETAQAATEVLKPTSHTYLGKFIDTGANAYDTTTAGDTTTSDTLSVGAENIPAVTTYHSWQTPGQTHTARNLYVMRSGTGNTDDTWDIQYSTDNGTGWTPIETGNTNPAQGSTTPVSIATGLDLSLLQVRIDTTKSGGPDGGTCDIFDVWLQCEYTPPVTSITNTPDTYDFGSLAESSTTPTGLAYFMVTNNGTSVVNITISGTDLTGSSFPWTLSDTATPGEDTYGLMAGVSSYNVTVKKASPLPLINSLAASANVTWGLQLLAPDTYTGSDGQNSGTVTLSATEV